MNRTLDAVVLGAGIAGSSLAKSLADRGWETGLFDRKTFPRHKVCGEFLSPESQSTLSAFGLLELVESLKPATIQRARLILNYGKALDIPLPGAAWGISRYSLDFALHGAALNSGVHVQTATTVTNVIPNEQGYAIETRQGEDRTTYQARAVIAAWGANGRSMLPSRHPDKSVKNSYFGVKSHYRGIEMEPVVELYFFDGGYVGVSPIEGGLVNVAALLNRNAFRSRDKHVKHDSREKTIAGWIDAACCRNSRLGRRLANAVPVPGAQAAVAPVNLTHKTLAWDIIPHVGDAALMLPPLCGDGMSMALRSARLCSSLADRYLRGEISLARWQQEYSLSIKQEFKPPLQWGRILQWLSGVPPVSRLLLSAAHLAPSLAYRWVQATRLKP